MIRLLVWTVGLAVVATLIALGVGSAWALAAGALVGVTFMLYGWWLSA